MLFSISPSSEVGLDVQVAELRVGYDIKNGVTVGCRLGVGIVPQENEKKEKVIAK